MKQTKEDKLLAEAYNKIPSDKSKTPILDKNPFISMLKKGTGMKSTSALAKSVGKRLSNKTKEEDENVDSDYEREDEDLEYNGQHYCVYTNFETEEQAVGHQAGYQGGEVKGQDIYKTMPVKVSDIKVYQYVGDDRKLVIDPTVIKELGDIALQKAKEEALEGEANYGQMR